MRRADGFTLAGLLIVVAVSVLLLGVTATFTVPMVARETMRSATYDTQTYLQLARVEAVSRNRECRFLVDTGSMQLQVMDTMGTTSTGDDERLYQTTLPGSIRFERPDPGAPVTLDDLGSGLYQAVFNPDGTVSAGTGETVLSGGSEFRRVSVYAAGGIHIERWNGSSWISGS